MENERKCPEPPGALFFAARAVTLHAMCIPERRHTKRCLRRAAGLLLVLLSGCTITEEGVEETKVSVEEIFPPTKAVASYRQVEKPKAIGTEALAEHLGGKQKLETLRKWSVFTSWACEYGLPQQAPKVKVSVTEMSGRVSAYGAYTQLRPALLPEGQYVKIGVHGALDGPRLVFVHDKFLIVVRALVELSEEQRHTLLVNFGRSISNRIPRPLSDIEPVAYLPGDNRVPASERLDKEDPLGLKIFEKGAITAVYRAEGREAKVFLAQLEEGFTKRAAINKFVKQMEKNGKVEPVTVAEVGYKGKLFDAACLVAQRENVVFGAFGTMTEDEMRAMLYVIDRKIKPVLPTKYKDVKKAQDQEEKEKEKGGLPYLP